MNDWHLSFDPTTDHIWLKAGGNYFNLTDVFSRSGTEESRPALMTALVVWVKANKSSAVSISAEENREATPDEVPATHHPYDPETKTELVEVDWEATPDEIKLSEALATNDRDRLILQVQKERQLMQRLVEGTMLVDPKAGETLAAVRRLLLKAERAETPQTAAEALILLLQEIPG